MLFPRPRSVSAEQPGDERSSDGSGPGLEIGTEDLRIEQSLEGGYYLFIRNTPAVSSVLITESTADPEKEEAVYALRNPEYHPENGDERRMLDGKFLDPENERYWLIDSTPEPDDEFGSAFLIYIPYVVEYGYPWSRSGRLQVLDGTFLNLRSFERPYADYRGGFRDNPYRLTVTQKPMEGPPEENYMSQTEEAYLEIAESNRGELRYSAGREDVPETIRRVLDAIEEPQLDLVLVLDTTQSMHDDMPHLRKKLVPILKDYTGRFDRLRVGIVYYRDYMEEYVSRTIPFFSDLERVQTALDRARVAGGRDIPEAVYEALYAAVHNYDWQAPARLIILIGDAPPHAIPRGKVDAEIIREDAKERELEIHTIILPH
ncbi:MAG: VWA domain-containing protein [Spirochaetales bacterium]|nr:VWA domain-containing protein [Spirochaetales bacterium]MCF7939572.1 VWA domain-containing protein [Spirochaetales bacterium]